MKKVLLIIMFFVSSKSSVNSTDKLQYINSSLSYNLSKIPGFLNNHFTIGGVPYYYFYNNNFSYYLSYSIVKKNISYKGGLSIESFSMFSDTAFSTSYCGSNSSEIKYTIHGEGRYICLINGIEYYPLKNFKYLSLGFDISVGYSGNATIFDDVIGCYGSQSYPRKLFLGSSFTLNGYLPIKTNWDLNFNLKYQLGGNHIDFFTHVNYGFGIGIRYKLK